MKNNTFLLLAVIAILMATAGCSNSSDKKDHKVDAAKTQDSSMAYICPMHCEGSGSNEPGKCNMCGMDLEKNK